MYPHVTLSLTENKMNSQLSFEEVDKIQYPLINQFYKKHYKKGIAKKSDRVFVIRRLPFNLVIACAKIKRVETQNLLTGVVCDPEFQHRGVASYLVREIQNISKVENATLYCFPYFHLHEFYKRLGFSDSTSPNDAIKSSHQKYNENRPLLLLEYR